MSKPDQDETMGWTTVDVRRISRQGRLFEVGQPVVVNASSWKSVFMIPIFQEWDNLIGAKEGGRLSWSMTFYPAVNIHLKSNSVQLIICYRTQLQLALRRSCHLLIPNPTSPLRALTRKRRPSKDHQTLCHTLPPQALTKTSLPSRGRLIRVSGKRTKGRRLSESKGTL